MNPDHLHRLGRPNPKPKVKTPRFRIVIIDEVGEDFEHCAKDELGDEIAVRLRMLGWNVTLKVGNRISCSNTVEPKGSVQIDVLGG